MEILKPLSENCESFEYSHFLLRVLLTLCYLVKLQRKLLPPFFWKIWLTSVSLVSRSGSAPAIDKVEGSICTICSKGFNESNGKDSVGEKGINNIIKACQIQKKRTPSKKSYALINQPDILYIVLSWDPSNQNQFTLKLTSKATFCIFLITSSARGENAA